MRRLPVTFVLLLISLSAFAQDVQISFDEEGHIYVIDRSLAASIGVFGDRDGFQEARLFRQSDGSFHIEISYLSDGQLLRERETLTESQVADLRARVESYLDDRRSVYIDQEGRPYFLRRTAAMSYLVYGPSLVGVLDIDDPGAATAVALLTGSAGFFVPFLMTRDRPVPMPAARMAFGGSVLGYAHGLAAAMAVGGDDLSGQAAFTSALVFSVGEATVGYRYGSRPGVTEGSARLMTHGGWFGLGIGALSAILTFGDADNFDEADEGTDSELRTLGALSLVGSGAGISAGHALGRSGRYTLGDAAVFSTSGILGAYGGIALGRVADADFRTGTAITIAGTLGGLFVGHALTRDTDFTESQSNYIDLGTFAGFLLGTGVGQLSDDDRVTTVAGALGSMGGFALMYATYRPDASPRDDANGWRLQIGPVPGSMRPGLRLSHGWH